MFKTVENCKEAIVIDRKSKFIGNCFYVESKEEAEAIISNVRKKYVDARHNCFAYRVLEEDGVLERQSDDGEPSGTAGGPMINILKKRDIVNCLVVVTRYFGGILLGTGGLVRAYSEAASQAIGSGMEVFKEKRI